MDGTTAGRLSLNPLIPQPTPSSVGNLTIGNATPVVPQPATQNSVPKPQYSQLTPVYAPTPTNTPSDIPQPAVKGIEFVRPNPVQAAPVVAPAPVSVPSAVAPAIVATPITVPVALKPVVPVLPVVNIPPVPKPATQIPTGPIVKSDPALANSLPPLPPPLPTSYSSIQEAEDQIENVDLDQMMGTPKEAVATVVSAPVAPVQIQPKPVVESSPVIAPEPIDVKETTPEPEKISPLQSSTSEAQQPELVQAEQQPETTEISPVSKPIATNATEAAKYYFQDSMQKNHDIPIAVNVNKAQKATIIRIAIIVAAVIIIGVGGFLVWGAVSGGQKRQATPNKTTTTQNGTTPTVSEPNFTTPAETTPTETTTTPVTTTSEPAVTETPAVTTPVVTTPAVTTPAVATPVATTPAVTTKTTPSVPDSGISDDFASLPKYLSIDRLSINAPIEQIDRTTSGAMDVPGNIWNAGWYIGSARPGQKGAAFIDGHSSSSRGALFGNLDTLKNGDVINVIRNDGVKVSFNVVNVKVVNRHDVDMNSMLKPYGKYARGLNIMSCVGAWIESEKTLENRVLVYAVQS